MLRKGHILFLENDLDYQDTVKEWLELGGYEVIAVSSPREAEEILLKKEFLIDLIISDLRVTDETDHRDFSGLNFASTFAPTIPKIILTRYAAFEIVRKALAPRPDYDLPPAVNFLLKNDGLDSLLKAVDDAFQTYVKVNVPQVKVGGALTIQDAAFYVERQAEQELVHHLKNMEYVLVIEPRQQGKTSLINYAMRHSRLANTIIVYIDSTTLNDSTKKDWYRNIYVRLLRQLKLIDIDEKFKELPQNSTDWREFLYTLANFVKSHGKNLIIALDETGAIPLPFATDFFSTIRDIYNSRQAEPIFYHLAFLLVGTFHPRDLIADGKISPFNIAKRVRLHDFKQNEFNYLISTMEWSDKEKNAIVNRIFYWTDGQPYLTQKLCEYLSVSTTAEDIDKFIMLLQQEDYNHLPAILRYFSKDEQGQEYIKRIISGEKILFFPAANQQQAELELIGIIKANSEGNCIIRNRIYEQAFLAFFKLAEKNKEKTMITPEQQIAIHILKDAFSLVANELKQIWKSKREKSQQKMPLNPETDQPGVSVPLQTKLIEQVENWQNESQLKMLMDNLQTATMMAEKYNKRRNKYRQQLPSSIDSVGIELQIEEAEKNRDKAITEIKILLENISKETIQIE